MFIIKNKKAGTPPAILLLVVLILGLVICSLFMFNIRDKQFGKTVTPSSLASEIYEDAEILDFYLGIIIQDLDRSNIVASFRTNVLAYKDAQGVYPILEFNQVEQQIDFNHIKIDNNTLKVDFNLTFERSDTQFKNIKYYHNFTFSEE